MRYSFTLHGPDGRRLVGFDNAHRVPPKGSRFRKAPEAHDHWHRTEDDVGRPYQFTDVDRLLAEFEKAVMCMLCARGVSRVVVGESEIAEKESR